MASEYKYKRTQEVRRALAHFQKREWAEAVAVLDPDAPGTRGKDAQLLRANILQASGRFKEALAAYRALAKRYPRDPVVLADLAEFYADGGQPRRAIPLYERALSALEKGRTTTSKALYLDVSIMASEAIRAGSGREAAVRLLARTLERHPESAEVLGALCELQLPSPILKARRKPKGHRRSTRRRKK